MKEMLSYGIDGWSSYVAQGTAAVFVVFSIVYLAYLFFVKRRKDKVTPLHITARVLVILFAALLCPGISYILSRINPTGDATYLFLLIPSALVFGLVGVELFKKLESGEHGRFYKFGLFLGAAALFTVTLTSPFLISVGHFSFPGNVDKLPKEIYEIADVVGDEEVLLPKRYAASMGEYSANVRFASYESVQGDETNAQSMMDAGFREVAGYVVVDKTILDGETLASLDDSFEQNHYTKVLSGKTYACYQRGNFWEMYQHGDVTGNQSMFYTLYNPVEKALIVVDGGWTQNADHVREVINGYGGHVTAWIITHYHEDHIGAFNAIYGDPQGIEIDDIYVSNYDSAYDRFLKTYQEHDNPETFALYMEQTAGGTAKNIHHPKRGEELDIAGLHLKFYNTYDEKLLELDEGDTPNNCGLVIRMSGEKDAVLFMGDMYSPAVSEWMWDTYGEELYVNYINCAHHGNSILPNQFYDRVVQDGGMMLFDAPEWLMRSEDHLAMALADWADDYGIDYLDLGTAPHVFYIW